MVHEVCSVQVNGAMVSARAIVLCAWTRIRHDEPYSLALRGASALPNFVERTILFNYSRLYTLVAYTAQYRAGHSHRATGYRRPTAHHGCACAWLAAHTGPCAPIAILHTLKIEILASHDSAVQEAQLRVGGVPSPKPCQAVDRALLPRLQPRVDHLGALHPGTVSTL